jgi:peptide chain release factor 1
MNLAMRERLDDIERTYEELTRELSSPDVASDPSRLRDLGRKHRELEEIVSVAREYRKASADAEDARSLSRGEDDPESREFYRQEAVQAEEQARKLEERLEVLLLPKDPNDQKNVLLEIRAGAGGQEAALFAADLLGMYRRYAERQGWKTEVLSSSPSDLGGFKEVVLEVRGEGAYSRLKHESGVHRVQRIPETESGGRIHTSTATVAVLPEAEEVEVEVRPEDVQVDVFRSSGPGGQSVNTTDSAVRLTHRPTGIVISVQEERSQLQNREKAMRYLRARLLKLEQERQQREEADARRAQVGTGERSEKIRTYNFPQSRVTDHRIGLTSHRLDGILREGELDEFVEALGTRERAERLGRPE